MIHYVNSWNDLKPAASFSLLLKINWKPDLQRPHTLHLIPLNGIDISWVSSSYPLRCTLLSYNRVNRVLRWVIWPLIWHPFLLCQFPSFNNFLNPSGLMLSTHIIVTRGIFMCYIQYHICYFLFHFHFPTAVLFFLPFRFPLGLPVQILFHFE